MSLETFIIGYTQAALWSSSNDEDTPYDETGQELSAEALGRFRSDCQDFYEANCALWQNSMRPDDEFAGHDFWLTRNGHGTGFWDRGLGEIGKKLTEACRPYGSCYLYDCDDGFIHCS